MTETKEWWQSKTIWGILIAFLSILFKSLGIETPELPANADADQIAAYYEAIKVAKGSWESITTTVLSAFGFLLALYGRVTAKKEIAS